MKEKIVVRPDDRTLIINGKKYIEKRVHYKMMDGIEHIDYVEFEPLKEKERNEMKSFIKEKIRSTKLIDEETILDEILKTLNSYELKRIQRLLKEQGQVERQYGCLGLLIRGKKQKAYISIFDG